ncbi:MAG: hypothetical protein PUB94_07415 [Oscillospiraceae bacterium]|nr:hypothetical protein [Oscillospiraceae bacterium]
MKKILSVILCVILVLVTTSSAYARETGSDLRSSVPVIYISGDSNTLTYDNGTKTFEIDNMLKIFQNSEDGNISEAAFNILRPFLIKGIVFNDWDDYYDAVYKEISDVYKPILLDENGNPNTDCDIPQWQKNDMKNAMTYNRASANGTYGEGDYRFYYDWRLDPIEIAEQLHTYIEGVKKASGHDKVSLSVKCLGSNIVLAYIQKYSTASLKGVGIDVSTSMGADFLSGILSGDFGIDGSSVSRLANELAEKHDDEGIYIDLVRFVTSTIDLLESTGVIDTLTDVAKEQLYSKIEYGIISALALSTFMTFPGYWALVETDDFEKALTYVFGEEGSEKRIRYKGLIDKITNYNETIKKNVCPIMQKLEDNGVNICVISKYGSQMAPVLKDGSILGDEYVSVYNSSFGATTSTIYDTLSDEYIAGQIEKGLGRYISPDKHIDASTCLFPDYTWFFKGLSHGYYSTPEVDLIMKVIDSDRQLTVNDFDLTQFIVYDYTTHTAEPMNENNCQDKYWTADETIDRPTTAAEKRRSIITNFIRWLTNLFRMLASVISGKTNIEDISNAIKNH